MILEIVRFVIYKKLGHNISFSSSQRDKKRMFRIMMHEDKKWGTRQICHNLYFTTKISNKFALHCSK